MPLLCRLLRSFASGAAACKHGLQAGDVRAKILQDAHGHAIPLPQDCKEDVLCANIAHFEGFCFVKA